MLPLLVFIVEGLCPPASSNNGFSLVEKVIVTLQALVAFCEALQAQLSFCVGTLRKAHRFMNVVCAVACQRFVPDRL